MNLGVARYGPARKWIIHLAIDIEKNYVHCVRGSRQFCKRSATVHGRPQKFSSHVLMDFVLTGKLKTPFPGDAGGA